VPTDASREAIGLTARTEAVFLDPTYTAKAMAGLIAAIRHGDFSSAQTVLFWHTGGQVGLFA
jgi:1-aminocyclopropane-1-carboxylate deaminase/D-cysteine desulfhydrase-like pyridoxal-dependent ACC family enzyme